MQIDNVSELGKLIKDTRKSQGLTQADLAISANVGVRFIVDLENGKRNCSNWQNSSSLPNVRIRNRY